MFSYNLEIVIVMEAREGFCFPDQDASHSEVGKAHHLHIGSGTARGGWNALGFAGRLTTA